MVTIIDYHCGNLGSIANMLKKLGYPSEIVTTPQKVMSAEKLILPGVGSFDYGMSKLKELGLLDALNQKVLFETTPVLGICLGAQLMCKSSEEGVLPGLGWVDAHVVKFPTELNGVRYTVPHMGWDHVKTEKPSKLFEGLENARFYFVHSYSISCEVQQDILCSNIYSKEYNSAFEKENIIGVQFHPEKSHKFGKQIFKNFLENY